MTPISKVLLWLVSAVERKLKTFQILGIEQCSERSPDSRGKHETILSGIHLRSIGRLENMI